MVELEFFTSALDFIQLPIILILSMWLVIATSSSLDCSLIRGMAIYLWHTLLCLIYFYISLDGSADSVDYYLNSSNVDYIEIGTGFILFIQNIFTNTFGLNYMESFLIFNLFGAIGLLFFDSVLRLTTSQSSVLIKFLATLVIFLPSLSFWTSAIGKDSVSFLAISLFLWGLTSSNTRIYVIISAIILMFPIRPHISAIMIVSIIPMMFNLSTKYILLNIVGLLIVSLVGIQILNILLNYIGLNDGINAEILKAYIDTRQELNTSGGSSLQLYDMNFLSQLIAFMFRPLPFEIRNFMDLIISLENSFLLMIFIISLLNLNSLKIKFRKHLSIIIYIVVTWSLLAMTTANLGIAVRQKWMILPLLIYLIFFILNGNTKIKDEAQISSKSLNLENY